MRRAVPILLLGLGLASLGACDNRMIDQQKVETWETTALFPDGRAMRPPPDGVVARGEPALRRILEERPPMTSDLLARGQERMMIFCAPCHGADGRGGGMVVRRGFPQPPSWLSPRLVRASDRHFMRVIQTGFGAMYSYAARVPPRDRWAIVAYIRALQLAGAAEVATLPEELRRAIEAQEPQP